MEPKNTIISGLRYLSNFVSASQQTDLLAVISLQPWITDLKRRVQHYGYRYDYKSRSVDRSMFLGALPTWALEVAHRFHAERLVAQVPDQLIINEYEPGQGIAQHVDCIPCFGDTILSLSLGSACVMVFKALKTRQEIPILLESGSLVIMEAAARYEWMHGIPTRKVDRFEGKVIQRGRRVSMTFRNVMIG